jgi:hypothetical protein
MGNDFLTGLWIMIFVNIGLIAFSIMMLIRNNLIYRYRSKIIDSNIIILGEMIEASNNKDFERRNILQEEYEKGNKFYQSLPSYNEMMWKFWKPLRSWDKK